MVIFLCRHKMRAPYISMHIIHFYYGYYYYYNVVSYYFFLLIFLAGSCRVLSTAATAASYDCLHQRCGDLNVPYPFTILNSTCPSFKQFPADTNFTLNCTNNVLYLAMANTYKSRGLDMAYTYNLPLLRIQHDSLIIDLSGFQSTYSNYFANGSCDTSIMPANQPSLYFDYGGPYISADDNKFGVFGCSAGFLFTLQTGTATAYDTSGCEPVCGGLIGPSLPQLNKSIYSDCGANLNCCISHFPAPARVTYYNIMALYVSDSSPCSDYAIPFHSTYTDFQKKTYGFRVVWALPDPHVLNELKSMKSTGSKFDVADLPANLTHVCSPDNSSQITVDNKVLGYRCSCLPGYYGDGYLHGSGCTDKQECNNSSTNLCVPGQAKCHNTKGSYICHCKSRWHIGDGMRNGTGCRISPTLIKGITVTGGVIGVMLILLSIASASILVDRRRKRRYFKLNCGVELQTYIAAHGTAGRESTRFFTREELREATQNFSEHLKLGIGGFGTVYRGTLKDGRVVAIKKANQPGDADRNQFLNELAILTQINHRHIVRLHGCCLETANPLLVYEFVRNGDLAENLASVMAMGWSKRLQVATQVADALAYLHEAAWPPILHRDVKTANILLDDNLDAKLADFGISRLIPEGEKCVSTVVQGTLGYLDPEYFQTLQLSDKSDVYSLGVVLVELITGLKAVDNHEREVKFANLALLFIDRMGEERVHELMDPKLDVDADEVEAKWRLHSSIYAVAYLAWSCLALQGKERPSMRELALKLHQVNSAFEQQLDDAEDELRPLLPA